MSAERKSRGPRKRFSWEEQLTELGVHRKNEVTINEAYIARNRYFNKSLEEMPKSPTEDKINGVKTLLQSEMGPENPVIRGPVEIARGKKLILGMTPDQEKAFAIVYDLDLDSAVSYYASVGNADEESKVVTDVLIKYCDVMPPSTNHLIASEALAKKLGVKTGQDIKILSVYQKTSDVNLDKI